MRIGTGMLVFILLSACSTSEAINREPGPGSPAVSQVETTRDPGNSSSELEAAVTTTAEALLTSINLRRALAGVPPLIEQTELTRLANDRAADMAISGFMGHVDPQTGAVVVEQQLQQAGFYGQAAELLFDSPNPLSELAETTIRTWFADGDHELVLLGDEFRYTGIGVMGDGERWIVVAVLTGDLP